MKHVLNFDTYLAESLSDRFPEWRELNSWKILQKMGFKEIEEKKNGTIMIENPDGKKFSLTTGGYIRDPLRYKSSNSIVLKFTGEFGKDFSYDDMFKYFLRKNIKGIKKSNDPEFKIILSQLESELEKLIKEPLLTTEQNFFLVCHVNGSWSYNPSTKRVSIKGDLSHKRSDVKELIGIRFGDKKNLEGLKFDIIDGNCYFSSSFGYHDGSFKGDIQKVTGDFHINVKDDEIIKSLIGSPREIDGAFVTHDVVSSLEGYPKKIGKWFQSKGFYIKGEDWNIEGFLREYLNGKEKTKMLISTIISTDSINSLIEKDPEKTIMELKRIWKNPEFSEIKRGIKIPEKYIEDMETISDLTDLGF